MTELTNYGEEVESAKEHHDAVADVPDGYEAVAYTIDPTESKDPEYGRRVDMIAAGTRPEVGVRADDAVLYECQRCGHHKTSFAVAGEHVTSANTRSCCPDCGIAGGTTHDDWRLVAVRVEDDETETETEDDGDAADGEPVVMTDGGADAAGEGGDSDLMDTLAALAGRGRVPVEDLSHRDDPRLHIETPVGEIRTTRKPDTIRSEGSARQRRWAWGEYRLEEERDGHPDLDEEDRHAVVVKHLANDE